MSPSTLETDDEENTDLLLQSEGPGNELAEIVKEVKQYNHVKFLVPKYVTGNELWDKVQKIFCPMFS